MRSKRQVFAVVGSVLTLVACQGQVLDPDQVVRPGAPGSTVGGSTPGSTPGGPPTTAACTPDGDPGRVSLHRLNRTEYNLTLKDLLGDTSAPASAFPVDDTGAGYDNNADVLSMSPLLYEKYDAAAEAVVAAAWARDVTASPTAKVRVCAPAAGAEAACARQILERFAHRAWRRPVSADELTRLVGFLAVATAQGEGFAQGTMLAMQAVLLSPYFIFRVELDPDPASATAHLLTDSELAARLSYFLWSSTPDDALLAAAEAGGLQAPEAIAAQVKRLLADPRATAFSDNLTGQWLHLRMLDNARPDATLFPTFSEPLREAMRQETRLFFAEFLHQPLNVRDMLDADFTFANDTLATHYGLPAVGSATPVKVALSAGQRGGLLTQAGILTATSLATRTSAVRRGKFVLGALLCSEPPPPPPGLPPLDTTPGTGSQRQKVTQATASGVCVSCHSVMNPLGFSMEHFDGVGAWRATDQTYAIDTTGTLPDGRPFTDVRDMSRQLKSDAKLTQCIARNVLTYALGRAPMATEGCALTQLGAALDAQGGHLSDLLVSIAQSPQFTQRRGEP